MIIIVSDKELGLVEDSEILVVSSLLEATKVIGHISNLIYHSSKEDTKDFAANMSLLKDKQVTNFWYVCSLESKDDLIEMAIIGNGGTYISDEFFLSDVELVKSLVESKGKTSQLVSIGGMGVLNDFVDRYMSSESSGIPENYLKVISGAIKQVNDDYLAKSNQVLVISEKATEFIEETSKGFKSFEAEKENLVNIIEDLKTVVEGDNVSQSGGGVLFFPRVPYRKEKDIVRVKDIGRTPLLLSFMQGFHNYAGAVLNKRPKLIVIEPVGRGLEEMYSNFTWITSSNYKDSSVYLKDVVFTNYPTAGVISKLLEDSMSNFFIVVDRTVSSREHILNCKNTREVHYSLSSSSFIDKLNLKKVIRKFRYFTSLTKKEGAEFVIPMLADYPKNNLDRFNTYLRVCLEMYSELARKG